MNGICPDCGKPFNKHGNVQMDHIIPISKVPKGTIYTIDDVEPLCAECNNKKCAKLLTEFEIIPIDVVETIYIKK